MKTFIIADTHFNHENIIKYCNRPFNNVTEMNNYIIEKWNSVVCNEDIVYHLGDFGFGDNNEIARLLSLLNGKKILLIGNHDLRRGKNTWKSLGFKEVYKTNITIDNIILSHAPIDVEKEYINIFGHIHNKPLHNSFSKENHFCVSCDVTEYIPVLLDDILRRKK